MFQPKIRRVLASAALVSALSLLPVDAALAQPRSQSNVAVRLASPFWNFLSGLLRKATIRIDPNGQRITVRTDPNGNEPGVPDGAP
jgi:hypothetical protein